MGVDMSEFTLPQSGNQFGPILGKDYGKCIDFEFYKSRALKYGVKPYYFVANGWWHCIDETDLPFPRFNMNVRIFEGST